MSERSGFRILPKQGTNKRLHNEQLGYICSLQDKVESSPTHSPPKTPNDFVGLDGPSRTSRTKAFADPAGKKSDNRDARKEYRKEVKAGNSDEAQWKNEKIQWWG
jgi:hypothetical protein